MFSQQSAVRLHIIAVIIQKMTYVSLSSESRMIWSTWTLIKNLSLGISEKDDLNINIVYDIN